MKSLKLGLIGLGSMGSEMATKFLTAGYRLTVYDIDANRLQGSFASGAKIAESSTHLTQTVDVVMTSLRSSAVWETVTENELLPLAKTDQIFIDFGTSKVDQTQRLAKAFQEKSATLLDVPVSGGPLGIRNGDLHMFGGGCRHQFNQCLDLFKVIGCPQRIVYCGPSGSGQIVKGVNQLAMGLSAAAYLEAVAFGVNNGIELEAIGQAVGGDSGWRKHLKQIVDQIQKEQGNQVYVKFPELPYFLDEADRQGYSIPLTQALYEFCRQGDLIVADNMGRDSQPFWYALRTLVTPKN